MTPPLKFLVVDDHAIVLEGTIKTLKENYPEAAIYKALTIVAVQEMLPDVMPDLLLTDLALPEQSGTAAKPDHGLQLLRELMAAHPNLNIMVQSSHVKVLKRLMPRIHEHQGGFTILDKNEPLTELGIKVDWALRGVLYTPPEMRSGLEVKPEWLEVLRLAFDESMQDRAIASAMNVSERSVQHYWHKLRNVLEVYPEAGKNIRLQTEKRAREEGLID